MTREPNNAATMADVICPSCGGASSDTARFCGTCGNPLQRICPSCGSEASPTHQFCSACGVRLDDSVEEEHESHPTERKLVTVVFVDVVDSTNLVEGMDPEEANDSMVPLIEAMRQAITRYGGIVTQVEGDGLMALFGAPVADEHHAVGACFAALDMPRLVKSANPDVDVRIGVHSGEVLVHAEDDGLSHSYVASGPTVHLASRMEAAGRPGIPLVTEATASLAAGNVRTGPPQTLEVRGFDGAIEVYELMGKADAAGSWSSRKTRTLTEFVARDEELEFLDSLLGDLRQAEGSTLAIEGGPGVGKSRLIFEFVERLNGDVQVLSAHSSPYDRSTPYRPVAEMMRSWLARRGGGPYNAGEVLEALDTSLSVYTDAIVALIGGEPGAAWVATDAGLRRQTTRRAIRAVLGAAAAERDTILVFEDVHWMDGESLSVLAELADLSAQVPVLVIASYRPESEVPWTDPSLIDQMELGGLMGTAVDQFVEALVGTKSSTAAIRTELGDRTDGTPLFLEEMVRSLADDGVLIGEPGQYKMGEADFQVDMPAEVRAVIASRIDRLDSTAKELLQLIAVHGEDVRRDLLEATTDRSEREITRALDALQKVEMVFEDDRSQPPKFAFKHNLIREVAYSTIPNKRREELHLRIAEGVMALEFEEDWTERLAYHTFEAGQWEDAARFALASAKRAAAKTAYGESERFLTMSLEALSLLPKNRGNVEQTIDALITRRISTVGVGARIGGTLGGLDDAEALANEIGDLERVARVNLHRSYARSMTGQHRQGIMDAERAHGIGKQLSMRPLTAEANLAKAQHYSYSGEPARVGPLIGRDLTFLRDEVGRNGMMGHRVVWAYAHLAIANGLMGNFDAAAQAANDSVMLAKDRGLVLDRVHSLWASALVQMIAENFKNAAETAREAADMAAAHEFSWIGNLVEVTRGYALSRLGSFDEGVAILEQSLAIAEAADSPMTVSWACVYLSELMTSCGQNEQARSNAQRALMVARKHAMRAAEVAALQMLGRAHHILQESQGFFEEALALSVEHSLRPFEAQIQAELGWIVAETGDRAGGRELLAGANAMRDEMGMSRFDFPGLSD